MTHLSSQDCLQAPQQIMGKYPSTVLTCDWQFDKVIEWAGKQALLKQYQCQKSQEVDMSIKYALFGVV